jgi:hypothetical protein
MAKARLVLVVCVAFLAVTPSGHANDAQCRQRLIHDWYADGRIQSRYTVSCYREAMADVPTVDTIYGTLRRDLTIALSSGIDRVEQEGITARPQTLLPAPTRRLATSAVTKPQKSHSVRSLAPLAFVLVLLLAWCVARWRARGVNR